VLLSLLPDGIWSFSLLKEKFRAVKLSMEQNADNMVIADRPIP